ncbi:sugar kinase [candidate division WOR-1 bacterium RIFOXYA12_FULL_52_29]|uniref:Sugar kinase n=1 Tax=candidate division WOR-1 bacterium RIFOXYC12_FULL_54_18 TaxID=1802584 RepID=A0A1F4T7X8_UNCSA|nr:MAG: sugar kinase [candidate division WOR-1 bacterium RIFOXYA2_FULL_51_19]OGC18233.1 MAG: sugar kinase [candidate division WOR-1 bacterium RIFOXYA12_FULL_52_29]OGC27088.1 MAG: sugar kinase [candidate division WOR-1 bacterium RIFOXYB2_FULL_45_9]OGC28650.1 MAG: sugar kinase [candidate division WOR-1 bacterium RIFOXYC12_FULL_54_18]OGC30895.1 MAG: sugar kinase [candidate division WOR-1 bacterium RIFOXYB12_FULL_52_16]
MSVLIVGTIALDSIKTPFGDKRDILGGSAVYAAVASSFFASTTMIGPIGHDFPKEHLDFLGSRDINLNALHKIDGPTFRWQGYYEYDMNQAHTVDTKLNILTSFDPKVPEGLRDTPYVFLANLDPELQLKVIAQLKRPQFIVADTMNFWIESKKDVLHQLIKKVDLMVMNEGEIRQFMETPNIPLAARRLIELGCRGVIVKKGEHGALFFNKDEYFSAPSYPQEELKDPTGAGDTFGGAFIGYLAKSDDRSAENIRRAVVVGSVMASFNVEDFSLERMKRLKLKEVRARFEMIRGCTKFNELAASHWE